MYRVFSLSALVATTVLMCETFSIAGDKVYVGDQVLPEQQVAMDQIDHSAWDAILGKYVDADGMVDYRSLQASPPDMRALDQYLATLSTASPTIRASRDGQLAFWINAYNAVTVRGILREYPTTSIRALFCILFPVRTHSPLVLRNNELLLRT